MVKFFSVVLSSFFDSNDRWRHHRDSEHHNTLFQGSELAGACIFMHYFWGKLVIFALKVVKMIHGDTCRTVDFTRHLFMAQK